MQADISGSLSKRISKNASNDEISLKDFNMNSFKVEIEEHMKAMIPKKNNKQV